MTEQDQEPYEGKFYTNAENYWAEVAPTIDGMLGGFGHITEIDIQSSRQFLKHLFNMPNPPGKTRALDCGAGIGRITKGLLSIAFNTVDLVEQNPKFLEQAKVNLEERKGKIGEFYPVGLQIFEPEVRKYDVIWCQWVLSHLTDDDLVHFLKSCTYALKENGVIVVKENVTSTSDMEVDEQDSSVTRSYSRFLNIFKQAELDCFKKQKQAHFPKKLFKVYTFALRPTKSKDVEPDVNVVEEINFKPTNASGLGDTMDNILNEIKKME